jgi:hypothetical protein
VVGGEARRCTVGMRDLNGLAGEHQRLLTRLREEWTADALECEPTRLSDCAAVCLRGCFTAPTFTTFVALVTGFVRQTAAHTVCGMLTGAGLEQVWHHSRAHRFFSNARWSPDQVGLALADLIVAHLVGQTRR